MCNKIQDNSKKDLFAISFSKIDLLILGSNYWLGYGA